MEIIISRRYYSDSLPRLLDGLQRSEEQRIEVLRSSVMSCVSKEKEVSPIIAKCHDTIAAAMHAIDPAKVNETTATPPGFEDYCIATG